MRHFPVVCGFFLVACGAGPAEPPATPAEQQPAPAAAPAEPETETPAEASDEPAAPAESESEAKPLPRTVKYIMTTGGLEIEVEGMRFVPKASPVKKGAGWGVKVEVDAKVRDDNAWSLLDPENGPLAFGGSIERDGKTTKIADKRSGDADKLLGPGDKTKLSREWPGKSGDKPLTAGQTLTLEVGLWGLGPDADSRRPVRDFFQVKMRVGDKGKPQPVITPPPSANP